MCVYERCVSVCVCEWCVSECVCVCMNGSTSVSALGGGSLICVRIPNKGSAIHVQKHSAREISRAWRPGNEVNHRHVRRSRERG